MVERRQLLGGGVMAGVATALGVSSAAGAQRDDDTRVAGAIRDLQDAIESAQRVSPELSGIRAQQRTFLKANQKYPDFIEVGPGVWENVYDWHVRHQQAVNMSRLSDGRYVMAIPFTTLILRPDQADTFIGYGFDAR